MKIHEHLYNLRYDLGNIICRMRHKHALVLQKEPDMFGQQYKRCRWCGRIQVNMDPRKIKEFQTTLLRGVFKIPPKG